MRIFRKLFHTRSLGNIRNLCTTSNVQSSAYEGPGKTTLHMLDKESRSLLLIDNCNPAGFTLNNGVLVIGPMIIFPKTILSWDIASARQLNESSLSLFTLLYPKLDLVVLGLDIHYGYKDMLEVRNIFRKENIAVEILPAREACSVFNFVVQEGRYVAGAMIPPKSTKTKLTPKM